MPIITVKHASPLTTDQMERLMSSLADAYTSVTQAQPASIHVLIEQVAPEQWGIGGQSLARRNA